MTRKEALALISNYLDVQELSDELKEAKAVLDKLLKSLPLVRWDDETIRDTFDQFVIDEGRMPQVKDLNENLFKLPSTTVLRKRYGIPAGKWLQENYTKKLPSAQWCQILQKELTITEWKKMFIDECDRIQPETCREFERLRNRELVPSWKVIARAVGVSSWKELKYICSMECKVQTFKVTSKVSIKIEPDIPLDRDTVTIEPNYLMVSIEDGRVLTR